MQLHLQACGGDKETPDLPTETNPSGLCHILIGVPSHLSENPSQSEKAMPWPERTWKCRLSPQTLSYTFPLLPSPVLSASP